MQRFATIDNVWLHTVFHVGLHNVSAGAKFLQIVSVLA